MITEKIGNIFDSGCKVLVNPVNCVGVMGKGLALEFKKRYPGMFEVYKTLCDLYEIQLGRPFLYANDDTNDHDILFFPTKDHWKSKSDLRYIKQGLEYFATYYESMYRITDIAFPALGCGNGGLSWSKVKPVMFDILGKLPINIEIYIPQTKGEDYERSNK